MFEPPYLHATEDRGTRNGIWLGTECLMPCGAPTPVHGFTHLCTYPDVFFYIPLFCCRMARILERFVL